MKPQPISMKNTYSTLFYRSKSLLSLLFLCCFSFYNLNAQTEDFEGETLSGTTFTTGGFLFNTTGDFLISEATNFSCGATNPGTNRYLDTGFGDGASSGSVGTIAPATVGVTFQVSTTVAQCAWTGQGDGINNLDGTIRVTGTRVDNTTISEDFFIDTTIPDDELVPFTFSAGPWAGQNLKSLEFILISPAGVDYLALDNFVFESISGAIVCPTVGAVSASETSVCADEPFNITSTGLANMDGTSNMEQDFGIQYVAFTSTPADPYVGGTSLGTVSFAMLGGGGTTASLTGATLGTADSYEIYAILSPAPTDATCRPSAMTSITVTAPPNVTFNLLASQDTFCITEGVQIIGGGSPTGGAYMGPGVTDNTNGVDFDFDPAAAGLGLHVLTYTFTDVNGCTGSGFDFISVQPLPTVNFTALADLCLDDGVQTSLGGGSPTGGPGDNYMGPGVTDNGDGTYDFDPAAAGVGTHVITYTFTSGTGCGTCSFGCTNTATDNVQVFAAPNANFTAPADLCLDAGVQNNLGGGTPTGGVYMGPGVSDDANGMTYDFDPAAAGVGTHEIIYTVGIAGCTGSGSDMVEVFALPTTTMTTSADFCEDAGLQTGLSGGTPTGPGGVYSGTGVTDDLNGMTYTFNPAGAGAGVHTIFYNFTDGNGCTGSGSDLVEVFALPAINFTALPDLCLNDPVVPSQGGATPFGGVYMGPGVSDDVNGFTYSFDPAAAGVGVHTLSYQFTDGNGCTGTGTDMVEVFSIPNAAFTAPADLCISAGVQNDLGGGTPTGGVYMGPGVSDDGNGMTYDFDPAAAGVGVHNITYTVGISGCSDSAMDGVEVFALPIVMMTGPADLCLDAGVQNDLGGGTPMGGIYMGPGVNDDANGMTYDFDPATAGVGTHELVYTFTDANGCTGSGSDMVEVFALPTVMFSAPADLCVDAGVQNNLGGGTPPPDSINFGSGLYAGPGVTDDLNGFTYSFDPAAAGDGVHVLSYTYTDENGCSSTATDMIEVFALPVVMFTATAPPLCVQDPPVPNLGGGTPVGGVYNGLGVTDDNNGTTFTFDPTASAPAGGNIPVTYTFTDANGCTSSVTDNIFVNPTCCMLDVTCPPVGTVNLECFDQLPTGPINVADFMALGGVINGSCNPPAVSFSDSDDNLTGCIADPRTVTRTITLTDPITGESVDCLIDYVFEDITPPTASNPVTNVACFGDIPPIDPEVVFDEMDNCPNSNLQVSYVTEILQGGSGCAGDPAQLVRFYNVCDCGADSGNCITVDHFINIEDDILPMITCPADVTVGCVDSTDPMDTGEATATDNCTGGTTPAAIWINEFHYDNTGGDSGEFVEVAGNAAFDLSTCDIVLYNGASGASYNTISLSGT
ncbi:MAG: hypothetical protein ACI8YQ_004101, partial [Polaribacter sp.]